MQLNIPFILTPRQFVQYMYQDAYNQNSLVTSVLEERLLESYFWNQIQTHPISQVVSNKATRDPINIKKVIPIPSTTKPIDQVFNTISIDTSKVKQKDIQGNTICLPDEAFENKSLIAIVHVDEQLKTNVAWYTLIQSTYNPNLYMPVHIILSKDSVAFKLTVDKIHTHGKWHLQPQQGTALTKAINDYSNIIV
jgi:hypothetical protein